MARAEVELLTENTAAAASSWVDMSAFAPGASLIVEGAGASDTCEVRVSNRQAIPGTDYLGVVYAAAAAVTANNIVTFTSVFRWVMVRRLTAGGTPARVNANLYGVTPAAR